MDAGRWERIQEIFHGALALPDERRSAFLTGACADDEALRIEVETLLREDARVSSVVEGGLERAARSLLGDGAPHPVPDLGPYRITGVLGEGGSGVVYRAERRDLGRIVAVKLLRDAWLSPSRRERFAAEQRMLAALDHPSIAHLYDADILPDGTPWFAMELVEGVTITEHCARRRSPLPERLALFRAVCEAVLFAHRNAIVHRDLKPGNVLVRADGAVKLLDFGIAKHVEPGADAAVTRTGQRLMTPAYAAPEQLRGQPVGFHTDVWALGVLLYELLAGRRPFLDEGLSPGEAEAAILQGVPDRPSLAARRASGAGASVPSASRAAWADLDVLCLTALQQDPARRYRSAEALLRDLDHFLAARPLEARPDSLGYRLGKLLRRRRRVVAGVALAALLLTGSIAFFTARLARARDDARAEAARAEHVQQFMLRLFDGGEKEATPAPELKVLTLLDRGAREAEALRSEPRTQAELFRTLGTLYQRLGQYDQADALLVRGLGAARVAYGGEDGAVPDHLVALGLLRLEQARLEEAERFAREGLDLARRVLPAGHPATARALLVLGRVLGARGRHEEALQALDEVVALRSRPGAPPLDLAAALGQLAEAQHDVGRYAEAEKLNERALAIYRAELGDRHPSVADRLSWLAEARMMLGRAGEVEPLEREALAIFRGWYGPDHPRTAEQLIDLARWLTGSKRLDEAEPLLREAISIEERARGHLSPEVGSALFALSSLVYFRGRYEEAAELCRQTQEVFRAVHGEVHHLHGMALSCEAVALWKAGQWARAEPVARRACDVLAAAGPDLAWPEGILGSSLRHLGRFEEAEPILRHAYEGYSKSETPRARSLAQVTEDLAATSRALGRPAEAARYEAERVRFEAEAARLDAEAAARAASGPKP